MLMNIGCILFGLCFIGIGIFLKPGKIHNGKSLCTGKIISINDDSVTVRYEYKKEEYFHEFSQNQLNLRYYSKGIKIQFWVDAGEPQKIIHILPGSGDNGAMSRLSLGLGLFFTIAGLLIFFSKL